MKTKNLIKILAVSTVLSGATFTGVWAFTNDTQDIHANNHTGKQSIGINSQMPSTELLQSAMNQVAFAESNYNHMRNSGNTWQINTSQRLMRQSELLLVSLLSEMSGVSSYEITEMHTSGFSWSQVHNQLGIRIVQPSLSAYVNDNDLHNEIMNGTMGPDAMHKDNLHLHPGKHGTGVHNNYSREHTTEAMAPNNYNHGSMMSGMH